MLPIGDNIPARNPAVAIWLLILVNSLVFLCELVRNDIPAEFLDLMALYPQPVRRQPSVEYLPLPRRSSGDRPSPK